MNSYLLKRRDAGADTPTSLNTTHCKERAMSDADSISTNSTPQFPHNFKDHSGKKFGRWSVVSFAGRFKRKATWNCRCDCGTERLITSTALVSGQSSSCGCYRAEVAARRAKKHGLSGNPLLCVWHSMISRCHKPGSSGYEGYGARGISVCDRWRNSVQAFIDDMGPRPTNKHSIDRIDNNGNYEPTNCRWATNREQSLNSTRPRMVTIDGETRCLKEWCSVLGICYFNLFKRIRKGETAIEIFTKAKSSTA